MSKTPSNKHYDFFNYYLKQKDWRISDEFCSFWKKFDPKKFNATIHCKTLQAYKFLTQKLKKYSAILNEKDTEIAMLKRQNEIAAQNFKKLSTANTHLTSRIKELEEMWLKKVGIIDGEEVTKLKQKIMDLEAKVEEKERELEEKTIELDDALAELAKRKCDCDEKIISERVKLGLRHDLIAAENQDPELQVGEAQKERKDLADKENSESAKNCLKSSVNFAPNSSTKVTAEIISAQSKNKYAKTDELENTSQSNVKLDKVAIKRKRLEEYPLQEMTQLKPSKLKFKQRNGLDLIMMHLSGGQF